ncbi:phosphate/phosphite/phosphonate ABC transporter substrate-binding protein [Motilimonas pumila]|uniref:Phosphate/phosphite/phosphonate ABC transporter substrate-binding protein n=1 Tax=Motilimonas pumila TaxID=2303987 RepID=A0A418YKN9_9GAMM|nr:PhnD/SsuA/transferrin family substrate-binding protein [Motilimonas pumila]RJG51548.1 hypothetical protein D1Z90_02110 [Motilimonas pumila]
MRRLLPFCWFIATLLLSSSVIAQPFVIARISNNPAKTIARLQPMADYLAEHLGDYGYSKGKVIVAKDYSHLQTLVKQERIDWITESGWMATKLELTNLASAELIKWKKGHREYKSYILVKHDSPILELKSLQGKVIGLEDDSSMSGFFMPIIMLDDNGLEAVQLSSPSEALVDDKKVHYSFYHKESNGAFWLDKGIVSAIAISSKDWHGDRYSNYHKEHFKIIAQSAPMPRAFELAPKHLSPELVEAVKTLMLPVPEAMPDLAQQYEGTTQFDRLTPTDRAWLERIKTSSQQLSL